MASKKMCNQARETTLCGASQALAAYGASGAHLPQKKPHFWQRNKNEQATNKHRGHEIRQWYGQGSNKPIGHGSVAYEDGEITVVCIERKEEHVSVVHVKNKSRVRGKCVQ